MMRKQKKVRFTDFFSPRQTSSKLGLRFGLNEKVPIFAALFALAALLAGCDDGRIPERSTLGEEGSVARLKASVTGFSKWPEGYTVALAGLSRSSDYAVISKRLPAPAADGTVELVMSGIPAQADTIAVCVLNRLRQRVATFYGTPMRHSRRDTMEVSAGSVDVSPVRAIQLALLEKSCVACHGANGFAAAGLNLTRDHFYASVVNVPSQKVPGRNIVTPGDAAGSVLSQVLNTKVSEGWQQKHYDMVNPDRETAVLSMVDTWIELGAEE